MKTWFYVAAGEPAEPQWRLQEQILRALRDCRPPRKAAHRIDHTRMECWDCGRTAKDIALDEWSPCFQVLR